MRISTLEALTMHLLNKRSIFYECEKTLPGLKHVNALTLDFYIPRHVIATRPAIIEIDGPHHFKQNRRQYCDKTWKKDIIKNRFAASEGLHLMRIDYSFTLPEFENHLDHFLQLVKNAKTHQLIHCYFGDAYE